MSTPTIIFMLVFMALIVAAMITAWKHMLVLNRYMATQPEMQRTVAMLNAALLNTQATLSDCKAFAEPAHEAPARSNDQPVARPARAPRPNRIAAMASEISSQQVR